MSNAQPDTRGAGGERRKRRSRGGRGRNRNRQENGNESGQFQNRGERGERGERQNRGDRDRNQNRGNREDRGPRPPRKEFKPAPLSWWQKLLKMFGLYKEPVRPPRPERKESVRFEEGPPSGAPASAFQAGAPREVKSNTRNARQGGAEGGEREPRKEREPRERGERGARGDRSERSDRVERRGGERSEVASARIYLGNLSYETTEEDLKDLFKGVGTVRNVEIVYNRRTHRSKGYGFVDMMNTEEAKRSVEVLHDQFFMGRKLVVSGAKSKEHEDAIREETVEERPRAAAPAAVVAAAVVAPVAAAAVAEAVPVVEEIQIPVVVEEAPAAVEAEAAAPAPEPEPVVKHVAEVAHESAPAAEHHEEQTPGA